MELDDSSTGCAMLYLNVNDPPSILIQHLGFHEVPPTPYINIVMCSEHYQFREEMLFNIAPKSRSLPSTLTLQPLYLRSPILYLTSYIRWEAPLEGSPIESTEGDPEQALLGSLP
jgi:hypothetical protein